MSDEVRFIDQLRRGELATLFGYGLFVGMMAVGYYYNVTFVQLGLVDLGERVIGLGAAAVAAHMAVLAVVTSAVALAVGWWMQRGGWSADFFVKLRLAFAVVAIQTVLTAVIPWVRSQPAYAAWILTCSIALGIGVPATFGLTVDLIATRDRGAVAAIITAAAYFAAAVLGGEWTTDAFRRQLLLPMLGGTAMVGLLAFRPLPWTRTLAAQHRLPAFRDGRFIERSPDGTLRVRRRVLVLVGIMFGIYFIDSLGFLRLIASPLYMDTAWHAPELAPRMVIGVAHVLAALVGGVLYSSLDERGLFMWIFGLFALVHLTYTFPMPVGDAIARSLLAPAMLYAVAVSLYTVLTFAIWADISTPATITRNAALGVALSGWTATFISTALAIQWELDNVPIILHLRIVASLSTLAFLGLLLWWYFAPESQDATATHSAQPGSAP